MPHPAPTSAQDDLELLQFALVVVFLSSTKQNISDTRDDHHLHKHRVAVLVACGGGGGIVYIRLCGWVWMVLVAYCAYINVWRYVVVHVRMYTWLRSVQDGGGAGVCGCMLA